MRFVSFCLLGFAFALVGCGPDYSPNVYSGDAVQQAEKVESGVVIGFRQIEIRSDGTVGAVAGGAAGGVLGTQVGDDSAMRALGAVGGALAGGLVGTTVEHTTGDTTGWEYIVREAKGDLVSVTQRQDKPIAVGQKVLVIFGKQARIVADYTTASAPPPTPTPAPSADKSSSHASTPTIVAPVAAPSGPPTPITPASASISPPPVPADAFVSTAPSSAPISPSSGGNAASTPSAH
ncbi:MAG TPA: glycine zipper 2TM domain-containing protein [Stellaceae bacterium]|nr:glycine zipper 2TM domain-containing protein [Stellaceae bacterium]